jgi:hypothetical protein
MAGCTEDFIVTRLYLRESVYICLMECEMSYGGVKRKEVK